MSDYSFRIRLARSPRDTANIETNAIAIPVQEDVPDLVLCARDKDATLKDADIWILKGSGWPSEQAATDAGERYKSALMVALAQLRIGADFGGRAPQGMVMAAGLEMVEAQTERRALNDVHGLMVSESEPPPLYVGLGQMSITRGIQVDKFTATLAHFVQQPPVLSERDLLSLELFSASFFQDTADARFLLLVIAVEALVEPKDRPADVVAHVDHLIDLTQSADDLPKSERDSLTGSLRWLRQQSIGQATRSLISSRLVDRTYQGESAAAFFSRCYRVRSRLVHGVDPIPTRQDVSSLAARLEVLVSNLISGGKMDISY